MNIPKLAIIRGPNLNKWDMQFYEPLINLYSIIAYGSKNPNFDLKEILFPIVQLPSNPEIPSHLIGLERELITRRFDLICPADFIWIFSLQAVKVKEVMKNAKVVVYSSEIHPFFFEENSAISQNKEIVRKNADMIIAATERAKETFLIEGVPEEKIVVVNRGVDIKRFFPRKEDIKKDRRSLGIAHKDFVILFIGRYDEQKGVSDIVFAAKRLCSDPDLKNIPFRFLMVGKGPSLEKMKGLIERLGLSKIFQFVLEYPYTEIHKLHNLSDALVLPSTIVVDKSQERFGMVLIEAMASGTPVISTYSGAIPEVVGNAGILVPPSNFICLADAIKGVILNKELSERLAREGRKRVEQKFDSIKIAEKLDTAFQKVLYHSDKKKTYPARSQNLNYSKDISKIRSKIEPENFYKGAIKERIWEIRNLQKQGRASDIRIILKEVERYLRNNMLTYLFLGKSYLAIEEWGEAEKWFRKVTSFSKNWKTLYHIAVCHLNLNKIGLTILDLERALNCDHINQSGKRRVLNMLGLTYERTRAFKKAEEYYLSALKIRPDSKDDLLSLGRLYLKTNELDKGLKIFENVLKVYPECEEASISLSEILWAQDKKEESAMKIASALDLNIDNLRLLSALITKSYEIKKFDILKKYLKKYLEHHPLNLDVLYELGRIHFKENNHKECKKIMEKVLIFKKEHVGAKDILKKIHLAKAV